MIELRRSFATVTYPVRTIECTSSVSRSPSNTDNIRFAPRIGGSYC